MSSEAFAAVTSCAAFGHLRLQVATSQEVSLPRAVHMFTPQDGRVAETPALQAHPPENTQAAVAVCFDLETRLLLYVLTLKKTQKRKLTSTTKESLQLHANPINTSLKSDI